MKHDAEMIADTVSPSGKRICTLIVTIPKFCNAQLNTHGRIAKNAESSRARSVASVIEQVMNNPYIPPRWPIDGRGMVPGETRDTFPEAESMWLRERDSAVCAVRAMRDKLGLHKEVVNRLLEPWMWQRILITATEWDNFFHLRDHDHAQFDMQLLARAIKRAMAESTPVVSLYHLPFIGEWGDFHYRQLAKISANRCKRISYGRGLVQKPYGNELAEAEELIKVGHMSPFEHQAAACYTGTGPFVAWAQFRKTIPGESDPLG